WPDRCDGLVSVYIPDTTLVIVRDPLNPTIKSRFWYLYCSLTPRGEKALIPNRKGISRVAWTRNSPAWNFTNADLDPALKSFVDPDYVFIVRHVYQDRLIYAPGDPDYAEVEKLLLLQPTISVPTVTLEATADDNFPGTNGSSTE
ncbi:hypothetical protein K505DRAFT_226550, partial [Melanomma pulvis-pyrius CBS 109.77]